MANNTLTGPASKGTHSGGKTFTPKLSKKAEGFSSFSNSSEAARRSIMGLTYRSNDWGTTNSEVLKRKPTKD